MGIEDRASRKFREIEEDAEKQHEQRVKNFLENFAKAKKIAEKARIVEMLKELEKAVSRERDVKTTQVWWTNKAVTYPQSNPVSVYSIGHLEVTPEESKVTIPKAFGQNEELFYIYQGLFFRTGLSWLRNKPREEPQSQSNLSMIGACVDQDDNIIVWPFTDARADYNRKLIDGDSHFIRAGSIKVRTISPSEWRSPKILEDVLIDSLTHPAQVSVQTK